MHGAYASFTSKSMWLHVTLQLPQLQLYCLYWHVSQAGRHSYKLEGKIIVELWKQQFLATIGHTTRSLNWNGSLNWNDGVYSVMADGRMYIKRYFMNGN